MKNIRIYNAPKYSTLEYEEVETNIYKTLKKIEEGMTLIQITEADIIKALENIKGWEPVKIDTECVTYNGIKYYKRKGAFWRDENEDERTIYVTSLMFEQEPEYGENDPDETEVSQYPLEDILDKFLCACEDFYEIENENDSVNSYMEFVGCDIQNIRDLLSIVGKHVYNEEDGGYIKLIIE